MKFGMNLLLWTGDLTESMLPLLASLKRMGYDGVELPIFDLNVDKWAAWARRLDDLGLERTAVTVRGVEDNPISPDPAVRAKGVAMTCRALDCSRAVGATRLAGPIHSALGVFSGRGPTENEWRWGVESVRAMAEYAGRVGVMLDIEPLNRFETYLLTNNVDAARFVRTVNHPSCKVLYDTFHANIEEKSVAGGIRAAADVMGHVHISENDRSTPGKGLVRWDETFAALKAVGYDGWLMIEAFGLALPELAAATKIWRRMYDTEEALARDGLAFMKAQHAKWWGAKGPGHARAGAAAPRKKAKKAKKALVKKAKAKAKRVRPTPKVAKKSSRRGRR